MIADEVQESVGQALQRHRRAAGLTQEELAEQAGISVRAISDLERGISRRPFRHTLQALGEALRLPPAERARLEATATRRRGPPAVRSRPPLSRQDPALAARSLTGHATRFIGRETEVAEVGAVLRRPEVRLLTLTGPGGVGKTRLALRVAEGVGGDYPDGVVFVGLASVTDPARVPSTIAESLSLGGREGESLTDTLISALRDRRVLLLLDNLEHLLQVETPPWGRRAAGWPELETPPWGRRAAGWPAAGPALAQLLDACPGLTLLVTSRSVLHLSWEHVYRVRPLAIPDPKNLVPFEDLARVDAVTLFAERARAAKHDFALDPGNAGTVAEICARLDGLPLAIELAASWVRYLPPAAILGRLANRLRLLTGGPRDLPARQQTVWDTIDWSYGLLNEREKRLFARLAVFRGGATLEAIEAVCGADLSMDPLAGAVSLADKSLLGQQEGRDGAPRLDLLETIREYAEERLPEQGDAETWRRRHAEYYLQLAEEAESQLEGSQRAVWRARLEAEHDNLHAALDYLVQQPEVEPAYRLFGAVAAVWRRRAGFDDARRYAAALLARREEASRPALARVLGEAAYLGPDGSETQQRLEESLALYRQLGDKRGTAGALNRLAHNARERGSYPLVTELAEESLALSRELGDRRLMADALRALGMTTLYQGQLARAEALLREGLALALGLDDRRGVASTLTALASVRLLLGTLEEPRTMAEEAVALYRAEGDAASASRALFVLGWSALEQGDLEGAEAAGRASLALSYQAAGSVWWRTVLLLACVAMRRGKPDRGACLWGAMERVREETHGAVDPVTLPTMARYADEARCRLGDAGWERAREEGRSMTLEQVVAYAQHALIRPPRRIDSRSIPEC